MGMDRAIKKKRWTAKRIIWLMVIVGTVISLAWATYNAGNNKVYRMDRDHATIATVTVGQFRDYIPVRGTIEPAKSMQVNIQQGGTVQEIYVEVGDIVKAGDPLVKFSNPDFELQVLDKAGTISEQINRSSETRLQLEQSLRNLKNQLTDIDYQIKIKEREIKRKESLLAKQLISEEEMYLLHNELEYQLDRRKRTQQDLEDEKRLYPGKIKQLDKSDERAKKHLTIVEASIDNLITRAPISGQLIDMDIEPGEQKSNGNLGRIDNISSFIAMAEVDEFYINRVAIGQTATFKLNGEEYKAEISKVYPKIDSGRFKIKFTLPGDINNLDQLRRGLNIQMQLELGAASESLLLTSGSFIDDTGGNWVFVLNDKGNVATKRDIRLGRKNNDAVEVRSGLRAGDKVIISSYGGLNEFDQIILND